MWQKTNGPNEQNLRLASFLVQEITDGAGLFRSGEGD